MANQKRTRGHVSGRQEKCGGGGVGGKISATAEIRFKLLFLYKRIWMISKYQRPPLWTCYGVFFLLFFLIPDQLTFWKVQAIHRQASETLKMCGEVSLTVDGERDLGLSYSNPWDDGLTYILAGIRLAHRTQIQLVAVTQNLWGSGNKKKKKKRKRSTQI